MIDPGPPHEFRLVAACCRWPLSEAAVAAIHHEAANPIDWARFRRVVRRQRVGGLVTKGLEAARIELPLPIAERLAMSAQRMASRNLKLAAESSRLQRVFDAVQIPVVILKGVALAQLAYGSIAFKHSRDIDLLVSPQRAEQAIRLLESEGYVLSQPAAHLSEAERRLTVQYGAEVELIHPLTESQVDLRWRVTENPLLFAAADASAPTQDVVLPDGAVVRTFADDNLVAYLCVHGATHAWSRLKWLADLNALIAQKNESDIERIYRHAAQSGGGLCAGLALLLCHRIFELKLPGTLREQLENSARLAKLAAIAMNAMAVPDAETELPDRPFGSTRVTRMQFLLGDGWPYFAAQCRATGVRLNDVIAYPLPASLHFLYPILRIPLWLWRRFGKRNG